MVLVAAGCDVGGSADVARDPVVNAPGADGTAMAATAPEQEVMTADGPRIPVRVAARPVCDPTATVAARHAVVATMDQQGRGRIDAFDFQTGDYRRLDLDAGLEPSLAVAGSCVYVLAKDRGEIEVLRAGDFERVAVWRFDPGGDPVGIVVINAHKAYVALRAQRTILIIDPQTGAGLGEVDFSSSDVAMGAASAIMLLGGDAYVTYDYMAASNGDANSGIARIDTTRDQLVATNLLGSTGVVATSASDGLLWIATAGNGPTSSCLESVDSRGPSGCLLIGERLGGVIAGMELDAMDGGVAVVRGKDGGQLVGFSKTGARAPTLLTGADVNLIDVTRDDAGYLWAADIGEGGGMRVYSPSGDTELGKLPLRGTAIANGIVFTP
jgi:hypothetical protein